MEEIIKISENNIVVRTYRLAKADEKIYEKTEVYGETRMCEELAKVEKEIVSLTAVDEVKQKSDNLAALQAKKATLLEIKAKLKEKDGE